MSRLTNVSADQIPPPASAVLDAKADFSAAVGGRVSTDDLDRLSYARDCWPLALLWMRQGKIPPPPDAVIWPGTEDEVAAAVVAVIRRAREGSTKRPRSGRTQAARQRAVRREEFHRRRRVLFLRAGA